MSGLVRVLLGLVVLAAPSAAGATMLWNSGGGVTAKTCSAGDFFTAVDGSGNFTCSTASGSGDVTAVGDCASGACFDGTTGTTLTFKNATSGTIAVTPVAGALGTRTISLPAETGTVCTTGSICSGAVTYQAGPLSGDVVTSGAVATIQANSVALTTDTTGNYAAGDAEAGNATGVACTDCVALTTETTGNYVATITAGAGISGSSSTEGGTPTIAFDYTNTLASNSLAASNCVMSSSGSGGILCEGTTADGIETFITVTDPTASDKTITIPNETGTVCTTGSICSGTVTYQAGPLSGDVVTSGAVATIQANSVALTTDTTGNYAAGDAEAGKALYINATSCTNGVQTASDGTPSCMTAAATPEYVSRVQTAGGTIQAYGVVAANGTTDDGVIEAATTVTQILGCSQSGSSVSSTNPVEVAVAGVARCSTDASVVSGSLVKLGATGQFALGTTAEETWGRALTDSTGASGTAYILLFDGAEGYIDHALDLWPSIPDITTNTVNMVNIAPSVDITGAGSLYAIRFAPTSTLTGTSSTRVLRFEPTTTLNGGGDLSTFYLLSTGGTITSAPTTASFGPITAILAHQTTYTATSAGKSPLYLGWGVLDNLTISSSATSGSATTDSYRTVDAAPTVNQTGNGGTLTVTTLTGFNAGATVTAGTGGTAVVTTRKGVNVGDVTTSGAGTKTITTNIGVDVAALSSGATNIGIRNADTTVYSPGAAQTLNVVGSSITPSATFIMVTASGATGTLTSNPQIADGVDGQIIHIIYTNGATGSFTFADGNGLQLAGAMLMDQNNSITLMYSSTIGDWIEIARSLN